MDTLAVQKVKQPTYPTYKPSGEEWLGDVPEHWKVLAIKFTLAMPITDGPHETPEFVSEGIPFLSAESVKNDRLDFSRKRGFISEEDHARFSKKYVPKRGDVYMVKSGATTGNVARVETDEVFNIWSPLAVLRPHSAHSTTGYIFYYMKSRPFLASVELAWSYGTQQNIGMGVISNLRIALPPLDEQQAIAAFLDRETARIDELIAKKQRLIELLAEKRTALISHAVTKGLKPDVPMKESGVDWLGYVPRHWNIAPLYARYWLELGKMLDAKQITGEHLVPYLRNIDVQWGQVNIQDLPEMDITPNEYHRFILRKGDLLVCEGGEVGRSAIWNGDLPLCGYQKALHRLRPRSSRDRVRFLYYALRNAASTGIFVAQGNPNTIPHLTGEQLRVYRLPFPPQEEQDEICTFLDTHLERLDAMGDQFENGIETLREYRSALISAAVTGKIDVREETA